jgi:hypothetical protein
MKVYKLILFIILLLSQFYSIGAASLKLVKEIGSDDENYIFSRILGAALSKKKDIYVLDCRANFLARYDWNGKFIKKIGQTGQGPGDFNIPRDLNIFDEKLYFLDSGNRRIAEVDLELKEIKYHKMYDEIPFTGNFFITGKNKCIGNAFYAAGNMAEYKAIKIFDFNTQWSKIFFEHLPFPNNKKVTPFLLFYSLPSFGIDRENKKIVISFMYPNNPIDFYVYSIEGECRETFSYIFDENYRPPDYLLEAKKPSKKHTKIMVTSIFAYKGHYLVLVCKTKMKDYYDFESERHFLVFDKENKELKSKFPAPNYLEAFSLSDDGYLLGTRNFEDIAKLCIYKLEI